MILLCWSAQSTPYIYNVHKKNTLNGPSALLPVFNLRPPFEALIRLRLLRFLAPATRLPIYSASQSPKIAESVPSAAAFSSQRKSTQDPPPSHPSLGASLPPSSLLTRLRPLSSFFFTLRNLFRSRFRHSNSCAQQNDHLPYIAFSLLS